MVCCSHQGGPSKGKIIHRVHSKQIVEYAMAVVLALLLVYRCGYVHCATVPKNSSTDMLALLDFRQAINSDPRGFFSSWNNSVDYCKWNGVICSRTHPGRVRELNLSGQSLQGQISPSLGNLTLLKILDLSSNSLFGQLPNLNGLHKLQFLVLSNNDLQGFAPDAFQNFSNLLHLDLSVNKLQGSIPPEIGFLSNLVLLNLNTNNFTGTIPSTMLNISQLLQLLLSDNHLEGNIPEELGRLPNVLQLALGRNRLSGNIPTTILNNSVRILDLGSNFLHMELPSNIGNSLPNLLGLDFHNNMLEGQIPASLGNVSHLIDINLASNSFIGQVPSSFGKLKFLETLKLENNMLEANDSKSWEFLDALGNCTSLQWLILQDNKLQGTIPNLIGKLSTGLQILVLSTNTLSGIVPESIGTLTGLTFLSLDQNNLTGPIGAWIGNMTNLGVLDLSENSFSGPIPSSIGNFSKLTKLYLQNNRFEGIISPSLGNLQLLVLNLSYNNLEGTIPNKVFGTLSQMTSCVLSNNNLEGPIPPEVSNLRQLIALHLSSNRLTGEIPDSLAQCQELQELKIDQNLLTGSIPLSLGYMFSLIILNLSHNNLSGVIPTPLADLQFITQVDLSYNDLEGEIPFNGIFANATAVSLEGNSGLCGGVKDYHMPTCPAVSQGIKMKLYLIILLILVFGFMSCLMSVYIILLVKKKSRRPYLILLSFGKRFPRVSYKDLAQATGNFSESNLIGRGSYGSVYKGRLTQAKIQVAIKVFDLGMRFANKSFVLECEALRTIRHRNLLPILTSCSTIDNRGDDFKALIYEFMHNGNLDTWLHQKRSGAAPKLLGLAQRISIAVDIADALTYLHNDCGRPIVHCDLKPTNILLDDDMNAHLGDFGIASLVVDSRLTAVGHSDSNSSVAVTGTIGYIAPEYAQTIHASSYGDVYSFGVLLLEMIIGKRPTDSMFEAGLTIISFVDRNFPDRVLHIVDSHLQEECEGLIKAMAVTKSEVHRCLLCLVQVALACTLPSPRERMNMREVAINLHAIRKSYVAAIK